MLISIAAIISKMVDRLQSPFVVFFLWGGGGGASCLIKVLTMDVTGQLVCVIDPENPSTCVPFCRRHALMQRQIQNGQGTTIHASSQSCLLCGSSLKCRLSSPSGVSHGTLIPRLTNRMGSLDAAQHQNVQRWSASCCHRIKTR